MRYIPACVIAALFAVLATSSVSAEKLGFDYLTPVQYKDLWRRADNYAMAEAFLRKCGKPSFVEARMRAAAAPCVRPEALNRVAIYFRGKVAHFTRQQNFICDTAESRNFVRTLRERIDKDVTEVRSMCSACFFC